MRLNWCNQYELNIKYKLINYILFYMTNKISVSEAQAYNNTYN